MNQIQVELQDSFGTDRTIAESAWTSSLDYQKKKSRTEEDVKRVVEMLATQRHSVPFESIVFRFWIKMPISTDRQFVTHRIASHCLSGESELYFDLPKTGKHNRKLFKMKLKDFVNKWNNGVTSKTRWGNFTTKKHRSRLKKMRLRSCNEATGEIIHTTVSNVFEQGNNHVFKFTFENGYEIESTLNHKYLTDKGWMTIGEALRLDSFLDKTPSIFSTEYSFSVNGIPAYKDFNYMQSLRLAGKSIQEMANDLGISYHTVRKWLKKHNLSFKKEERCFKKGTTPWNKNLRYKQNKPYVISPEEKLRKSKAASGPNSNFWKGGITPEIFKLRRECTEKLAPLIFKRDNYTCQKCGSSEDLNAHHVIPVYADKTKVLDIENLITLCKSCHIDIHKNDMEEEFAQSLGKVFVQKKPKGPKKTTKLIRTFSKVKKVEYIGYIPTYDIEVSGEYKNFVCNGVIVHNSGLSGRYRTMPQEFQSVPSDVDGITSKLDPNISYEYDQFCNMTNNWYQSIIKEFKQAEKDGKITNAEFKRVREFYRGILPQNNMTERVTTMNLRSFANFIKLRLSPHAQPEIRRVAELMLQEVKAKAKCPIAIEWLEKNGWEL